MLATLHMAPQRARRRGTSHRQWGPAALMRWGARTIKVRRVNLIVT